MLRKTVLYSVICLVNIVISGNSLAEAITLQKFIDLLEQNHPIFRKERLSAQIQTEDRMSFLGTEDWQLSASAAYSHLEPAVAFAGPEQTDALTCNNKNRPPNDKGTGQVRHCFLHPVLNVISRFLSVKQVAGVKVSTSSRW